MGMRARMVVPPPWLLFAATGWLRVSAADDWGFGWLHRRWSHSREEFEKADKRWRSEHGLMGARPRSRMWSSWDYRYGNNRTMHGRHQTT